MLHRVSPETFGQLFPTPSHVFNSVAFSELNGHKCDDVHYLAFADERGKVRLGIILGEKADTLRSPFSAPFGGMEERHAQKVSVYIEALESLKAYARSLNKSLLITLPPACYETPSSALSSQYLAALSLGASLHYSDFNYHYDLSRFPSFKEDLRPQSRNKLSAAMRNGFDFHYLKGASSEDFERVYSIIKRNHEALGYPLRMTLDDVIATSKIIKMDLFVLTKDGSDVAGALVYHSAPTASLAKAASSRLADGVVQVVYWGDLPEWRSFRPMNFLAYKVIGHYYDNRHVTGVRYFDIGPSSSEGRPSLGLCDFKESLGCNLTPKATLKFPL